MPGYRSNRNSDVLMEERFKYAISKKSRQSKPCKINWMPESDVRLSVAEENQRLVIKLEVLKPRLSFTLTQENLCGLETGKITAPVKLSSCWNKKAAQSSPYLLIVYVENSLSQMILLLCPDSDDDEVTKRWKWKIHTTLGFAKSWPNLEMQHATKRQKIISEKTTLMLGKTWLAFFKYVSDSLPTFWKRFSINSIIELKLVANLMIAGKTDCVIKVEQQGFAEEFTITSERSQEIYQFVESYRNNSNLPNAQPELPSLMTPPSNSSVSPGTTVSDDPNSSEIGSSPALSRAEIPLYPVDVSNIRTNLKRKLQDIYIHPKAILSYCFGKPPTVPSSDIPPPSPCRPVRQQSSVRDFGYIDRPYMSMMNKLKSEKPISVALPDISTPVHKRRRVNHLGYSPDNILKYKIDYLTLPPIDVVSDIEKLGILKENITWNDPFQLVPQPSCHWHFTNYAIIGLPYPSLSLPFPPMETIDSIGDTPSMEASSSLLFHRKNGASCKNFCPVESQTPGNKLEQSLRFEFDFSDVDQVGDKPLSQASASDIHLDQQIKASISKSDLKAVSPPSPCRPFKKRRDVSHLRPSFYRSRSESAIDQCKEKPLYAKTVFEKLKKWSKEGSFTLTKETSRLLADNFNENIYHIDDDDDGMYSYVSLPEDSDQSLETEDLQNAYTNDFDLNMLTFPINSLDKQQKQQVFHWVKNIVSDQQKKHATNSDVSQSQNCLTIDKEENYYSHGVRMRRSISQTQVPCNRRTSSLIYGYWSATKICRTIDKAMRNKPPLPDTLCISIPVRKELCMRLYTTHTDTAKHDWQALAGVIGLTVDCVSVIELCIENHALKYTAAEIVLRHWQFIYNKYWTNGKSGRNLQQCPEPCTKERLMEILHTTLQRPDLVDHLKNDKVMQNSNSHSHLAREVRNNDKSNSFLSYTIDDELFGNNDSSGRGNSHDISGDLSRQPVEHNLSESLTELKQCNSLTKLKHVEPSTPPKTCDSLTELKHGESLTEISQNGSLTNLKHLKCITQPKYNDSLTELKHSESLIDTHQSFTQPPSVVLQHSPSYQESFGSSQGHNIRKIESVKCNGRNLRINKEHRKSDV